MTPIEAKVLPWLIVGGLLLGIVGQNHYARQIEQRLAARDRSIALLTREADSLRPLIHRDTVWLDSAVTHYQLLTIHDTLPGRVDTIPVVRKIIATADTAIQACRVTVSDCTRLAQLETARADSLDAQVRDWQQVAAGPWLHPALELTTGPGGLRPAGELAIGHQLELLGRVELPLTAAPTWRLGVRWLF